MHSGLTNDKKEETPDLRRQRIDVHTDSMALYLHLDQYRKVLDMISSFKRHASKVSEENQRKSQRIASPSVAKADSPQQGKGWFSWAWDIMIEEEYVKYFFSFLFFFYV